MLEYLRDFGVNRGFSGSMAAGLPQKFCGMYSSSGFDMIDIMSRVKNRPNPQIDLGPVDLSSSFIVVDARKYDHPIVYCSESFERLTGYTSAEIVGTNCRFLQSPDGKTEKGKERKYVDNSVVYELKNKIDAGQECQLVNINYRKGGQPFVNLITIIPVPDDTGMISYFVGFQVDLMTQSQSIMKRLEDGSMFVDTCDKNVLEMLGVPDFGASSERVDTSPKSDLNNEFNGSLTQTHSPLSSCTNLSPSLEEAPPDNLMSFEQALSNFTDLFPLPTGTPDFDFPSLDFPLSGPTDLLFGDYDDPMLSLPSPPSFISQSLPEPSRNLSPEPAPAPALPAVEACYRHPSPPPCHATHQPHQHHTHHYSNRTVDIRHHKVEIRTPVDLDEDALSHYSVIQNSPDCVHILSSRGIILYASPRACIDLFGFEAGELIGRNISKFCHGGDLISLMRELKNCKVGEPMSVVYRFQTRSSGYVWIEVTGKKYEMKNRKRTKCYILSARRREVGHITLKDVFSDASGALLWAKVSPQGLILYVAPNSSPLFGVDAQRVCSLSLVDLVHRDDVHGLRNFLASSVANTTLSIRILTSGGKVYTPASICILSSQPPSSTLGVPTFLYVRIGIAAALAPPSMPVFGGISDSYMTASQLEADVLACAGLHKESSLQYELNQLKLANKRILEELAGN
ncbi:blue light receptor [Irineochytrium annulatum]|nr:blue light receptor [Irineochytrium annulatum]